MSDEGAKKEEDKRGRLHDLEGNVRFGLVQMRRQYESAFQKAGLDCLTITEVGWNALECAKHPLPPTFEEWRQQIVDNDDLEEIQPDERGHYERELAKYQEHLAIAKQVAKETVAECSFLYEYESVCDQLDMDSDDFALGLLLSIMVSTV